MVVRMEDGNRIVSLMPVFVLREGGKCMYLGEEGVIKASSRNSVRHSAEHRAHSVSGRAGGGREGRGTRPARARGQERQRVLAAPCLRSCACVQACVYIERALAFAMEAQGARETTKEQGETTKERLSRVPTSPHTYKQAHKYGDGQNHTGTHHQLH